MDPISMLGTGVGVASLLIQAFSGCIKGYQLFQDAVNMPSKYSSLRTKLRLEQARLWAWGEKVGIAEVQLSEISGLLKLNRNMILDVLFEIQELFRSCLQITGQYDGVVDRQLSATQSTTRSRRSSRMTAFISRPKDMASSLQWSMIKADKFENLVTSLIAYNDRIEGFLDRQSLKEVHAMQLESSLMLLQLTEKVDELRDLALAANMGSKLPNVSQPSLSRSSTLVEESSTQLAELADFKARSVELKVRSSQSRTFLIPMSDIDGLDQLPQGTRQRARYDDKPVWIEWREDLSGEMLAVSDVESLRNRVNELAALLSAEPKPLEFQAPHCLGYIERTTSSLANCPQFGFVFQWPTEAEERRSDCVSLRELFNYAPSPSLSQRVRLARMLAECLLNLHAVNWLHKGIRSEGILFFGADLKTARPADLSAPLLSGFDLSRPDLPEAMTMKGASTFARELYRHPELQHYSTTRSRKIHDTYSLGVVLVEIVFWAPIEQLLQIQEGVKGSTRQISRIREQLLDEKAFGRSLRIMAGDVLAEVVRTCIEGQAAFSLDELGSTFVGEGEAGALLQDMYLEKVVNRLQSIVL